MVDFKKLLLETMQQRIQQNMATAPKVNKFADDNVTNDLPDEYNEEEPGAHSNASTTHNNVIGLTMEELAALCSDNERDSANRKRLDPPSGDWLKKDRWKCQPNRNGQTIDFGNDILGMIIEGDSLPGDTSTKFPSMPQGRLVFVVFGKPEPRQVDNDEYQPTLFIRVSPDQRYKEDEPEKLDLSHKLWLRAKDLYLSINKEDSGGNFVKVISMLIEDEYKINTFLPPGGDSGLMVTGLKTKELQRRERR